MRTKHQDVLVAPASLARRAAASSPSKANVPPLSPSRSALVRWVTTKLGTPGHGVPLVQPLAALPHGIRRPDVRSGREPVQGHRHVEHDLAIARLLRSIGAAVRRRHEKVGVDPDVLTSPREPEARRLAPSWA